MLGQESFSNNAANDDDQNGANDGSPTARTLFEPWDAWTDGERLLIGDHLNYRILLWEAFPASDFAPADFVIGQNSMTTRHPVQTRTPSETPIP